MANVGKEKLVATAAEKLGATKKATGEAFDAIVESVKEALDAGDKVTVTGLVTLEPKVVPAHERTHSLNGVPETITVPERIKVKAKASSVLTKDV